MVKSTMTCTMKKEIQNSSTIITQISHVRLLKILFTKKM